MINWSISSYSGSKTSQLGGTECKVIDGSDFMVDDEMSRSFTSARWNAVVSSSLWATVGEPFKEKLCRRDGYRLPFCIWFWIRREFSTSDLGGQMGLWCLTSLMQGDLFIPLIALIKDTSGLFVMPRPLQGIRLPVRSSCARRHSVGETSNRLVCIFRLYVFGTLYN